MDTIVLILILLTAFNFLLKQTFWKPIAVGVTAAIAAVFVILVWPYAIEQSKTQIADWLSDNQLMLDLGDCFADGILPVGCSRGKFLSGQKAYDVGISCIVLVSGSFDIPGSVFRFDPSDILFSGSFI